MSKKVKMAATEQSSMRALSATEQDAVAGAGVTYYYMNGHWHVIGHDKYGKPTNHVVLD
jgi:hypothetical protein